jgi:hypothetical protein
MAYFRKNSYISVFKIKKICPARLQNYKRPSKIKNFMKIFINKSTLPKNLNNKDEEIIIKTLLRLKKERA